MLAETLNRILSLLVFSHSPKQYISDLSRDSALIEDVNETFRSIALDIRIFSFYETLQTALGPKYVSILEKDTAILGYPKEVSQPLNADHHGVCKFGSRRDLRSS